MTTNEKKAIAILKSQLQRITASNPNDLDDRGYKKGWTAAATLARDALAFIENPPTKKDLQLYANQPTR